MCLGAFWIGAYLKPGLIICSEIWGAERTALSLGKKGLITYALTWGAECAALSLGKKGLRFYMRVSTRIYAFFMYSSRNSLGQSDRPK